VKNHPNGTYIASARKLMATLVTSDDLQEIMNRFAQFYQFYAEGEHEKMLDYFNEITPRFMDKKLVDQETLLNSFRESQQDVESEEITIDTTTFAVTKDTSGVFTCKFTLNSQRKVKKTVELSVKRGRKTVKKNGNTMDSVLRHSIRGGQIGCGTQNHRLSGSIAGLPKRNFGLGLT